MRVAPFWRRRVLPHRANNACAVCSRAGVAAIPLLPPPAKSREASRVIWALAAAVVMPGVRLVYGKLKMNSGRLHPFVVRLPGHCAGYLPTWWPVPHYRAGSCTHVLLPSHVSRRKREGGRTLCISLSSISPWRPLF
jgi:hypothetical protein